jgi:diguanylate cyclase (GGDEF)-like protein
VRPTTHRPVLPEQDTTPGCHPDVVGTRVWRAFDLGPEPAVILVAARDEVGTVAALRVATMNAAGRAFFEVADLADAVGRDLRTLLVDAGPSGLWAWMLDVLDGGGVGRTRTEHVAEDGIRTVETVVTAIDPDGLLMDFRDVTDQVAGEAMLTRAYEETAEMRATLQTALDATSDGFAVYGLDLDDAGDLAALHVLHANAAGAESLGLDPDAMIGMEVHEFFPEVETSGLWERLCVAASTKAPQYHRVHVFDANGDWQSSWDNTVAPVGEERMAITWRNVSAEEAALRQLARTRDEAMYSATHDALTDLPNRVLLRQHLREALRTCAPDDQIGLVFVDLDRFKAINDTYGHAAGDAVLRATAARLSRLIRHGDMAARLAGDEFVLVLTRLTRDWQPEQFFERAAAVLSEPVTAEAVHLSPSASLGVVLADVRKLPDDVDDLIKEADAAMYRNKAARRASR